MSSLGDKRVDISTTSGSPDHRGRSFVQFVATELADAREKTPENGDDASRLVLLTTLNHLFSAGYDGPESEYELIGFVWLNLANRCESPLLWMAEKLWLDFEESEQERRLRAGGALDAAPF